MKSALLIGLTYPGTPYQLYGCINDVNNMSSLLVSNGYSNITKLIDSDPLLMPTRNRIIQELKKIVSTKSSELFIFYSGHGSRVKDANKDEQGGMDSVIVPYDFKTNGFIVDDELLSIIKNITCKCTLLFDSCNSGTVCDLQWNFEKKENTLMKYMNPNHTIINSNIFMISGCKDQQQSNDIYDNESNESCGLLTSTFIKCLRDSNHNINLLTLYNNICNEIMAKGFINQVPTLSSSSERPEHTFQKGIIIKTSNVSANVITPQPTPIVKFNQISKALARNMASIILNN
jgi:hypothetical protein